MLPLILYPSIIPTLIASTHASLLIHEANGLQNYNVGCKHSCKNLGSILPTIDFYEGYQKLKLWAAKIKVIQITCRKFLLNIVTSLSWPSAVYICIIVFIFSVKYSIVLFCKLMINVCFNCISHFWKICHIWACLTISFFLYIWIEQN